MITDKELYELFGTIAYAETPEQRDEAQDRIYDYLRDLEGQVKRYAEQDADAFVKLQVTDSQRRLRATVAGQQATLEKVRERAEAMADTGRGILDLLDTTEEKE